MTIEGMQTPDELEEAYEDPVAFDASNRGEILEKFEWLMTRQRAEFLIFLTGLQLEVEVVDNIFGAFEFVQADFSDFMIVGLDVNEESPDVTLHPLSNSINETIEKVLDGIIFAADKNNNDDSNFVDSGVAYEELGTELDETIIHRLGALTQKYPIE